MEKEYTIQYFHKGELLKGSTMTLNKEVFNDMVHLVGLIADNFTTFEFVNEIHDADVKVFSGEDFIFNSTEEYSSYLKDKNIEYRLRSDFGLETYVNGERYY